jgi:hypothetical protein
LDLGTPFDLSLTTGILLLFPATSTIIRRSVTASFNISFSTTAHILLTAGIPLTTSVELAWCIAARNTTLNLSIISFAQVVCTARVAACFTINFTCPHVCAAGIERDTAVSLTYALRANLSIIGGTVLNLWTVHFHAFTTAITHNPIHLVVSNVTYLGTLQANVATLLDILTIRPTCYHASTTMPDAASRTSATDVARIVF